jgi:ubiquinone biosynthesis protein
MWALSRPLVEDWMRVHRSPPARAAQAAAELAEGLQRLPALFADVERGLRQLGEGGLKLHPDTLRLVLGTPRGGLSLVWPLWVAALALAALALSRF